MPGSVASGTSYIIPRMRIACWITKATDTHSEFLIFITSALQEWLRERASMLRYTYTACLIRDNSHLGVFSFRTPSVKWDGELQQNKQLVSICSGKKN
jgi:hypothetical protein